MTIVDYYFVNSINSRLLYLILLNCLTLLNMNALTMPLQVDPAELEHHI